jgi:hypothetical protein
VTRIMSIFYLILWRNITCMKIMCSTPVYQKRIMGNLWNLYWFTVIFHDTFGSQVIHIVGISFLHILSFGLLLQVRETLCQEEERKNEWDSKLLFCKQRYLLFLFSFMIFVYVKNVVLFIFDFSVKRNPQF